MTALLLRQGRNTLFADLPHLREATTIDHIRVGYPTAQEPLVKLDFVVADLGGDDSFFVKKPVDRLGRFSARTGDVDPYPFVPQIAVGFREVVKSIPLEHDAYPWGIALVHLVDPEGEYDGKVLLPGECGEQGVFRAARPASFRQHEPEVRPIGVSPIRKLVEVATSRAEVGDAARDEVGSRLACGLQRGSG